MSKRINNKLANETMKSQYDFTNGKRTNHASRYHRGHEVHITQSDGSVTVQHFTLKEGAVLLEPDVRAVFKNSKAVNKALRCLIPLVKQRHPKAAG